MLHIDPGQVPRLRTISQLLARPGPGDPAGVAGWFGAMQAQDLQSGLWSLGVRLPGWDRDAVEAAVASAAVLRTWPMRGTIHFVAATDASWMLATTGVRALRTSSARWRALGLDESTAMRAVEVITQTLEVSGRSTRSQVMQALREAGIDPGGQRGYHLLVYASLLGVTCIGPNEGAEQTFVLLSHWAPEQRDLTGDEALAELALRYFRSHGPTTRQDFMGWTGLTAAQARTAIAAAGDALTPVECDGASLVVAPATLESVDPGPVVHLLPGFDEYVLGYKDRSGFVPHGRMEHLVPGGNGVFRPTLLVDGIVAGTWSRTITGAGVKVVLSPFEPLPAATREAVQQAAGRYARYLGLPLRR
jgi:hypothetical protein